MRTTHPRLLSLGTAKMIQVLSAFYDLPSNLVPSRRAERQYRELDSAIQNQPDVKSLITRLEAHYGKGFKERH